MPSREKRLNPYHAKEAKADTEPGAWSAAQCPTYMAGTGAGGRTSRLEEWISHTDEAQQPRAERRSDGAQRGRGT